MMKLAPKTGREAESATTKCVWPSTKPSYKICAACMATESEGISGLAMIMYSRAGEPLEITPADINDVSAQLQTVETCACPCMRSTPFSDISAYLFEILL